MATDLLPGGAPLTMTSREIADLVEKRHDNVARTIETLADRGVITLPQFEEVPNPGPGPQVIKQFRVGKRDSYVIVAQLSPEFTAKLVDRWQALEQAPPALNDPVQLRTMLLGYTEKVIELESRLAVAAPKVEALDRIAETDGLLNLTGAAKALQVQPSRIFNFVRQHGWIYRRAGGRSDVAYQDKISAGLLTHKIYIAHRTDGSERVCEQVMVTPKGLAKLAQALGEH